jgi:hypothetical protein
VTLACKEMSREEARAALLAYLAAYGVNMPQDPFVDGVDLLDENSGETRYEQILVSFLMEFPSKDLDLSNCGPALDATIIDPAHTSALNAMCAIDNKRYVLFDVDNAPEANKYRLSSVDVDNLPCKAISITDAGSDLAQCDAGPSSQFGGFLNESVDAIPVDLAFGKAGHGSPTTHTHDQAYARQTVSFETIHYT